MRILPAILLAIVACGDDRGPTVPLDTAEALTAKGWVAFERGDFADAAGLFEAAIARDRLHEPAYVGEGWSRLELAADTTALHGALSRLDAAIELSSSDSQAHAGRAAALLALGENIAAVAEARATLQMAPGFVFAHAPTFDGKDLYLIAGSGLAAQGEFTGALGAAVEIEMYIMSQSDPATWVVDGIHYRSFADAVIAYLAKLSATYAG
jgi:tetratricopeptide (TPR) repeat protein